MLRRNQELAILISQSHIRPIKYGYACLSTEVQNPALQLVALKTACCKNVSRDKRISGRSRDGSIVPGSLT
jgi:hypothetical protein